MKPMKSLLTLLLAVSLWGTAVPLSPLEGSLFTASAEGTSMVAEPSDPVTVYIPDGASVTLDGETKIGQNGVVTFDKAPGSYAFSVAKAGYVSLSDKLTFDKSCTVHCDLAKAESDILSGVTVTAVSASGYYGNSATPDKAYNGNFSDGWQSAGKTPGDYIQFMFPEKKDVGSLTLYWERGSRPSKSQDGYTVHYTVDGTTWQTFSGTSYTYAADTSRNGIDGDVVSFGHLEVLGLRVVIDGYATNYSPKLYEVAASAGKSSYTVTMDGSSMSVGQVAGQLSVDGDSLRLLSAVDTLNYRNAGFDITVAGEEVQSQRASNQVYNDAYSVESERFGIENGYLFALVVNGLPDTFSLRVRPFVTDLDGNKVYGRMATVSRGRGNKLTVRSDEAYYIDEGWQLARVPDVSQNGATVSQNSYNSSSWVKAVVPGTVLTSYYEAGLIDNPDYDDNIAKLDEAYYNVDYWYRSTFTSPALPEGKRVWLNFDGINWKADIYLNGTLLGHLNGAFIRGMYDVTDYLKEGENSLAVYLYWCNGEVADMPSFLCTKSWDFMPAIPGRDVGVYKDVYLTVSDNVTLQDAYVETDLPLPDTSSAKATVSTFVQNNSNTSVTGTLSGVIRRDNGTGETYGIRKQVTLSAGEKKEVFFDALTMDNPDLWWPNGSGEQNLYKLDLSFTVNGQVSDTTVTTFGVREYSYDFTANNLIISVNGRDVLVRGGNWAVPDNLLDVSDDDFNVAVRMHKDMGFNMIRNWHGANDFESFYKYCDKYGIMVFEDFWLNGWGELPNDHDMFMSNVDDKVLRLRSHACLAVWCSENEAKPWAPYDVEIPAAITKYDYEGRLFVAASNEGAVSGGINYALQSPTWYFEKAEKFCTELGSTVIPTYQSVCRMVSEANRTVNAVSDSNAVWNLHGWNGGVGNKVVWDYKNAVTNRYGGTNDFETFCDICQLTNYETYRAMFEAWNDGMFDKTQGVLLWMSHPTWGSVLWQVYDAYQAQTGGYYGSKIACEEVHVQWNPLTSQVKLVNTSSTAVSGNVAVTVYNLDGTVKHRSTHGVTAPSDRATAVTTLTKPSDLSNTYFLDLEFTDNSGNKVSQNFYWLNKDGSTDYTAMKDMQKVTLTSDISVENHMDGTSTMTVTLTNPSSVCAVAVDLSLEKSHYATGEDPRVLPTWYEDNWFSLTPGETRTLTVTYNTADLCGADPVLNIGGFNVGDGHGSSDSSYNLSSLGTAFDCGVPVYDNVKVAAHINDNDMGTGYQPQNFTKGDYCGLTFDKDYTLSSLTLYWETASYIHSYTDGGYKVYVQTDGNWVEVTALTADRSDATDTLTFHTPVEASGVKIEMLSQPDGKYAPQLMELQVYGK